MFAINSMETTEVLKNVRNAVPELKTNSIGPIYGEQTFWHLASLLCIRHEQDLIQYIYCLNQFSPAEKGLPAMTPSAHEQRKYTVSDHKYIYASFRPKQLEVQTFSSRERNVLSTLALPATYGLD